MSHLSKSRYTNKIIPENIPNKNQKLLSAIVLTDQKPSLTLYQKERSAKIQGGSPADRSLVHAATCNKCELMYIGQIRDALIYLSVYLSIYLSIYVAMYISIIYLSIFLSIYLSVYLSTYLSLSIYLLVIVIWLYGKLCAISCYIFSRISLFSEIPVKYQFDVRQDMISISLADELVGNHLGNFTTSRLTSEKGI